MSNTSTQNLISFDEVIHLAKLKGVSFGKGDPYNRIRYYIKIGLLPKASRKSFNGLPPAGALPIESVDQLVEIDTKIKSGKNIQKILDESKSEPSLGGYVPNEIDLSPTSLEPKSTNESFIAPTLLASTAVSTALIDDAAINRSLGLTKKRTGILFAELLALLIGVTALLSLYNVNISKDNNKGLQVDNSNLPSITDTGEGKTLGSLIEDGLFSVFVHTNLKGELTAEGGIKTNNTNVDAGTGELTASNVIYSINAGSNVSISGGQNPTISVGDVEANINGTPNRIAIGGSNTIDIASNYSGQSSISTLGTITSGSWQASAISDGFISDALTINSSGSVDWTALTNYPVGLDCGVGNYVQAINDALTCAPDATGGSPNFSTITTGTNTIATMTVGTGASLVFSGSGIVRANEFVASGSTTGAVDLATAEVAGTLADGNISDTLTIGSGSSISATAINSGTLGNAGVTLALGSFGSITGSLGDANVLDNITLTNITQITNRAISDTTGILGVSRGGTGADLSATGGANQFVRQNSAGGVFTVSGIIDADVPDTLTIGSGSSVSATAINSGTLGDAGVTLALGSFGAITGTLGDANVSDTLTASIFIGSGSTTNAIDLATAEAAGILTLAKGGTGADLSATGGANQFVRQNSAGGVFTVSTIADADIPDNITASSYLPLAGGTLTGTLTLNDDDGVSGDVNLVLGDGNESGTITTNNGAINAGTGTGTFGDIVCGSTACITLGTETDGNYVASTNTSILTGLTGGSAGSEGAALTLGFDYSTALSGNLDLAAHAAIFGQSGLIFEGSTGGAGSNNETFIVVTDPTTDRTITIPDNSGTLCLSNVDCIATSGDSATSFFSTGILEIAIGGTGAITSQGAINNLSQLTTNGDLLYHNGTNSTRLARGGNGSCLTSTAATIQWGSCGAAGSVTAPNTDNANEVAFFTADDVIDGDANFTWNGATLTTTGSSTNSVNLQDLNLALAADDGDADTLNALNIDVTSFNTDDADQLRGINISNLASADAQVIESAIRIGTSWDYSILLAKEDDHYVKVEDSTSATGGGALILEAGAAGASGQNGGWINLTAGSGIGNGAGGTTVIQGGGSGTSGTGGNVSLIAGTAVGGTDGYIRFETAAAERLRITPTGTFLFEKGSNDLTMTVTAPTGASRTANIPSLTADDDFVFEDLAQTLTNKTISGASNTLTNIGNGSLTNSSITFAGDSGSSATSLGGTRTLAGGTNGIDTTEAGGTVTFNFDSTEVGSTTWGANSDFIWTFDPSGATNPTIAFTNSSISLSNTLTFSNYTTAGGILYTNGSGVLAQTAAGSGTQCLLGGATPGFGSCASGVTWDVIGDPAGNGAIAFGSTVQTMDWAAMDANASFFSFNFTNAGTSAGTDSGVVINNALNNSSSTDNATENLLLIQQLDDSTGSSISVSNALKIDSAANSHISDGIEITNSGGNITNALNIVDTSGGTLTSGIAMSGTLTNGVALNGTYTTAINFSAAATTGINLTESGGTLTTGINITGATNGVLVDGGTVGSTITTGFDVGSASAGNNITTGFKYDLGTVEGINSVGTRAFMVDLTCLGCSSSSATLTNGIEFIASDTNANITNGINFSGAPNITNDFVMQNGETISNDTDSEIQLNGVLSVGPSPNIGQVGIWLTRDLTNFSNLAEGIRSEANLTNNLTSYSGISIQNPTVSGAGATTTNYGLYIANQTRGGTSDYGIYLEGAQTAEIVLPAAAPKIIVGNGTTGALAFTDGTNTLCTITDGGSVGNLDCTGTITGVGAVGYWTLSSDAIRKATDSNKVELLYGDAGDTQLKVENTTNSTIPTVDSVVVDLTGNTTGIVTNGVDALFIGAEFGNGTSNTNSGIHLDIDLIAASGDEVAHAILIDGVSATSASKTAISVGTNWDTVLSGSLGSTGVFNRTGVSITNGDISGSSGRTQTAFSATLGLAATTNTQTGLLVTPPSTTSASGVTYGVNIGPIGTSNGTDTAVNLGTGWDTELALTDTSPTITIGNGTTGVLSFTDGTNTLCTITDNGTTGNFSCTNGAVGPWTSISGQIIKTDLTDRLVLRYGDVGDTQLTIENTVNNVIPTTDSMIIDLTGNTTGIVQNGVDGLFIGAEFGNGTTNTNSGLHIDIDPVNTPSGDETFHALLIDGITNSAAAESAIRVGTGWDTIFSGSTDNTVGGEILNGVTISLGTAAAGTPSSQIAFEANLNTATSPGEVYGYQLNPGSGGTGTKVGVYVNSLTSPGAGNEYGIVVNDGWDRALSLFLGANGQALVVNAATIDSTLNGSIFDIDIDSATSGNIGFDLNYQAVAAGGATTQVAFDLTFQNDNTDGTDTLYAMRLTNAAGSGVNLTNALLVLNNADAASSTVTRGIDFQNSGGGGYDIGIDLSASSAFNSAAISLGANTLLGTTAVINFTNFDVSSTGLVTLRVSGTDVTSGTNEDITIAPNGTGTIVLSSGTTTGTGLSMTDTALTTGNLADFIFTSALTATGTTTGLKISPTLGGTASANTYTINALDLTAIAGSCPNTATCRNNAINIGGYQIADADQTSVAINIADQHNGTGTHYGICFDCDGVWNNSTTSNGISWGNDASNVTLYRVDNEVLGIGVNKDFRIGTNGIFGALQFGTSGDVALYRGSADFLYLAPGDSLRINSDGSTASGNLNFGASGDVYLYRPSGASNTLRLDSPGATQYSSTTLQFGVNEAVKHSIESSNSGLAIFTTAAKNTFTESWRIDDNGTLTLFQNRDTIYSSGSPSTNLKISNQYGVHWNDSQPTILIDNASSKLSRAFYCNGAACDDSSPGGTYYDVTSAANDSKHDTSFTVAAASTDSFYFSAGTGTDMNETYYFMKNGTDFGDPGFFLEYVEYASGSDGSSNCSAWTTTDYYPGTSFTDTGNGAGDYWTPVTATNCKVNNVFGKWYRYRFPSHTFPTGAITAYSFSRSLKVNNVLDIKVDGSSLFKLGYDGTISNDIKIGSKTDATPHTFASDCSCLTNLAAGTFDSDTSRDAAFSSAVYKGKLYVATKETNSAAVYRYDGGATAPWTQVSSSTDGNIVGTGDTTSVDAIVLAVWNGKLYAGTQTGGSLASVYYYDGSSWTQVSSATEGTIGSETSIDGVSDMTVYNGKLYIATQETDLANFYRYDGGAANNNAFTRVNFVSGKGVTGDTASIDSGKLISYLGRLWWGVATQTSTTTGLARLYMWDGTNAGAVTTTNLVQVNSTGGTFVTGTTNIEDVSSLAVYNGQLFVGTADLTADLANIYVYTGGVIGVAGSGVNFIKVSSSTNGRIDANDATDVDAVTVMKVYKGRLYAGIATGSTTGSVYKYDQSTAAWTRVNNTRGTFGAQTNVPQVDTLIEYNGTLYVGTESSNVGSIYSYTESSSESYSLQFDSNHDILNIENSGSISFIGNQNGQGNANGSFIVNAPINSVSGSFDLSEEYPTFDTSLTPGDIVSVDSQAADHVKKANAADKTSSLIGIVTTDPGFVLGAKVPLEGGDYYIPIALTGRVPVKVTTESGAIEPGDLLTQSSIPGVAAKAGVGSPVIGKALDSYDNPDTSAIGKVSVFVQNYSPIPENEATDRIWREALKFDEEKNVVATLSSGTKFKFNDSLGNTVAFITDKGDAFFNSIQVALGRIQNLIIGDRLAIKEDAQIAGSAAFEVDQSEILIETPKVNETSLIYLTPKTKTKGLNIYLKEIRAGEGFVVGLEKDDQEATVSATTAIEFNWLIVDQEQ